jgi:hypothetical protein
MAPTPTASTAESKSSSTTAIGVGIGVGIGAVVLLGVAIFFFWRRKERNNIKELPYAGTTGKPAEIYTSESSPHIEKYAQYATSSGSSNQRLFLPFLNYLNGKKAD